ncbi:MULTISPECIES: MarR family winged helix-turn-helix transcriptional regulator [unclassified Streptomyces]|uniref:MarR family winged helix-turn-helix transcriptional regulator n=1 Tax=unclassified Streptomyces TaxID=2593676 RepID=UPI0022B6A29F|nr:MULTISPECIES: MarR family transcriptional regulator [unclassified Streptomyces]MCZ7417022.1 MarR family transcriptional regulator [Streptomyces sp. WMMC897]MCZ7433150.1 MarR family transcriptional regulator [Streptomyces sp. WMMC1477]
MADNTPDTTHPDDRQPTAARLRKLPTRLMSLAAIHSDRLVNEALARADARKWHYAVLATLEESGAVSQAELSSRTGIYRSDMVAVVNELAERRLVGRSPDPADRRRNVVTITRQGRARLRRLDELLATAEDAVLAPLTVPEREQLTRLLATLVDHHGRTM